MIVSDFTRKALAERREARWAKEKGWQKIESDWRLFRGVQQDWRVAEVKVSVDGKHLLFRTEPPRPAKP